MNRLSRLLRDPVSIGFWSFTLALAVKTFQQVEHTARLAEKHVLEWPIVRGVLGAALDFDLVQFAYHAEATALITAALVVYVRNPGIWRRSSIGLQSLVFSAVLQTYLYLEYAMNTISTPTVRVPQSSTTAGLSIEMAFLWDGAVLASLLVAYLAFRPSPLNAAGTPIGPGK